LAAVAGFAGDGQRLPEVVDRLLGLPQAPLDVAEPARLQWGALATG
jgi:hypothetical protein